MFLVATLTRTCNANHSELGSPACLSLAYRTAKVDRYSHEWKGRGIVDWKLELVGIPLSHVKRAKTFYAEKVGFTVDHDHGVSDDVHGVLGAGQTELESTRVIEAPGATHLTFCVVKEN